MIQEHQELLGIRFDWTGTAYRASVGLSDLSRVQGDPAERLKAAAATYQDSVSRISEWRKETTRAKSYGESLTARRAWDLGDLIIGLRSNIADQGFAIVDLYRHLSEHTGIPYWSHRFATFRTYIPQRTLIPADLGWNRVGKRARAEAIGIMAKEVR